MPTRWTFAGHLITVAVGTALVVGLAILILAKSETVPFGQGGYRINAAVPATALLTPGARVTMAGAQVGNVVAVDRAAGGRPGTHLELHITDKRVVPIPADSRLQIRTRSQVGENYVSISVGRSRATLASGAYIAAANDDELVDVDRILSVLQGPTKARARELLRSLGGALDGRSADLSQTLQQAAGTVEHGGALVDVLHRDRVVTARLVDQLGQVAADVGERGQAIDMIARRGTITLTAVGDRDRQVAATLRALPQTIAQIHRTTGTVGRVTDEAAPVLDNITHAVHELRPAIDALAPAAREGSAVVSEVGSAAPKLRTTLQGLTKLARPLPAALPQLRRLVCQVNPALRYIEPYKTDIFGLLVGLGSASNSYDATGHLIRLAPIVNDNTESGLPPQINKARSTLLNSGLVLKSKVVNYDPFMRPGIIGTTKATSNKPNGPAEYGRSGYRYPRVKADC